MNTIDKAMARLDRVFDSIGRVGSVILASSFWGMEFADASGDAAKVVEKLAYDYYTTPETIAAELLLCCIYNAADCEPLA